MFVVLCAAGIWGASIAGLSLWRQVLAGVLILDVAAGAVANFTRGTNDFYASRPKHRWWFIALHVHLPLIGLAINEPLWPYLAAWAYTIFAASVVNLMHAKPNQVFVAGLLISLGIIGITALPLGHLSMMVSLLFMFKVAFGFAVDHYT